MLNTLGVKWLGNIETVQHGIWEIFSLFLEEFELNIRSIILTDSQIILSVVELKEIDVMNRLGIKWLGNL